MIPIIQEVQIDQGITQYREQLMERHKNRDPLTDQELQFLATTSELLNKNIDKTYVQNVIDQLDEQIIDSIESNIAEEIIQKYNKIITIAKEKRKEYLKRKVLINSNKINKNVFLNEIKEDKNNKHSHQNLMKNRIIEKLIEGYKPSEIKLHIKKQDYLLYNFFKSLSDKIDADQPLRHTVHNQRWKQFYSKQVPNVNKQEKTLFTLHNGEEITIEKSQRLYHPSSKIVLNIGIVEPLHTQNYDGQLSQKQLSKLRKQKEEMMLQRVSAKKTELAQKKDIFQTFYSCGPLDQALKYGTKQNLSNHHNNDTGLPKRNPWINDEIREKAAIIIQKNFRMRLAKKRVAMIEDQKMMKLLKRQKSRTITEALSPNFKNITIELSKQFTQKKKPSMRFQSASPQSRKSRCLSQKETQILMGMNFKHKQRLVLDRVLGDDTQDTKSEQDQLSTRNASPIQSNLTGQYQSKKSNFLQDSTFMSSVQGMNSPQSTKTISNQKQDFSSFLERISDFKQKKNILSNSSQIICDNNQLLSKMQTMQYRSQNSYTDQNQQDLVTKSRYNTPNKYESRQNISGQLLKTVSSTQISKSSSKSRQSQNIQYIQDQINALNASPQFKDRHLSAKTLNKNITSQKQKFLQNEINEEERQKNLEKLRAKMYKNSLLVKQQKLLSAAIHNTFISIKNAGYILNKNDVNVKDKKGNSPLYYVVHNKNEDFANFLLDLGANVNEVCEKGNTPMHEAFLVGNEIMIINLMDKGGDLNVLNQEQLTPLAMGSYQLIKKMGLESGIAKIKIASTINNNSPKKINIEKQQTAEIKYQNGALEVESNQPNIVDNNALFKRVYKKKKVSIDIRNKQIQMKIKEQELSNQILTDIQAVENEQNIIYQFQNDLQSNSQPNKQQKKSLHIQLQE